MSTVASTAPASASQTLPEVRGAVRVRERVIDKIVRAAAAAAIGVQRDDVAVEVVEQGRTLLVRIGAKLPIPDLADTEAVRAATPVLERVREIQASLLEQLAYLTGRDVRRVSFTVTGAVIPERKRVR